MSPEEYIAVAKAKLESEGNELSWLQLNLGKTLIGYRSEKRLRWLLSRLHVITAVVYTDALTEAEISQAVDELDKYSKNKTGARLGMGTGIALIAVFITSQATPNTITYVTRRPAKRFAVLNLPILLDVSHNTSYRCAKRSVWGILYKGWLEDQADLLSRELLIQ